MGGFDPRTPLPLPRAYATGTMVTPLNFKFYKHDTRILKYHKRVKVKSELFAVSYFGSECTIFLSRFSPPKSSSWDPLRVQLT